jgi:hypothetical protein
MSMMDSEWKIVMRSARDFVTLMTVAQLGTLITFAFEVATWQIFCHVSVKVDPRGKGLECASNGFLAEASRSIRTDGVLMSLDEGSSKNIHKKSKNKNKNTPQLPPVSS